jgi:hypothetical protein
MLYNESKDNILAFVGKANKVLRADSAKIRAGLSQKSVFMSKSAPFFKNYAFFCNLRCLKSVRHLPSKSLMCRVIPKEQGVQRVSACATWS